MSMPQQLPLRQDEGGDNNMMGGTNNYGGEQNILQVEPIAVNATNSHYGETHHNNHQHHQAGEDGDNHHVLPPLYKRHDSYNLPQHSFLGNVGQFTTTTTTTTRVTNTNYNTDVVGDASGDNSIDNNHNHTDHMNRRDSSFSDRRDSLLGLARRIHLLQDNEAMSFNRRRGSMGSLSEGIPGATGGPSLLLMESEHDNAPIDIGGRDSDNNDECNNNNSSINNNQNADSYDHNGSNQNGISNSNNHNNAFAKELAARAPTAQMLATEESKRLEENLMRLEMRRMIMMTQQQQQQQVHRQHQPQGNGNGNNNPTHQIYPARPQRVNETNYNTMNTMTTPAATTKNDAPIVMRQSNDQPQKMMAQQQFYNQGNNFDHNQMMNWQQGINNTNYNNTNNTFFQQSHNTMNGYNMQTTATVPVAAQQDTATLPHNSTHNTYQQRQIQTQTQEPPPKATPSAPRRPLSAYNIFFSEMRNKLLTEEGDESDNTCEQDDNNEDEEAPQNDDSKAEEDKQEGGGETPTATGKNKQLESFADNLTKNYLNKDPKKRRAHRKTHGKVAFVSLAKMVGQKWRSLPEDEKKKYQDLAAVDQKRYKEEKMALAHALREEAKRMQKEGKMKGF